METYGESGNDDQDQLQSVHFLATQYVGENTEGNLTYNGSSRGCYFNGGVRIGGNKAGLAFSRVPVNDTQHGGDEVDSEDIIGVGEETYACDDNGTNMIPTERSLIDLGKGKTPTLIGILDLPQLSVSQEVRFSCSTYMDVVVMKIMEGGIPACCLSSHA